MTYTEILANVRSYLGVDANKWSTAKITVSVNKALDKIAGYAIGADKTFRWDDSNHTKMPIGTTNLVASQSTYSFLTDEQGNRILTLTGISRINSDGKEVPLTPIDITGKREEVIDMREATGTPLYYDKISDNVVELLPASDTSVTGGLKFYFQRTPSYFTVSDTTKEPGFTPEVNEYIVLCAALEGAISLGLPNLVPIREQHEIEYNRMTEYFTRRNEDEQPFAMRGRVIDCR
jgi:hypothetical protein